MAISVERLEEILASLESDWARICEGQTAPTQELRKVVDQIAAIRELIAIKEAEPVAYIGNEYGDPVAFARKELIITGDIQALPFFTHLIARKPE